MVQNNISASDVRTLMIKIIFLKNYSARDCDPFDLSMKVYDSEGNQRGPDYTLVSVPPIIYTASTKSYQLEIDVSDFPDGAIEAHWFAKVDGAVVHDDTHNDRTVQVYQFEEAPAIIRLGKVILPMPATRYYRDRSNTIGPYQILDEMGSPYTPDIVRARITDPKDRREIAVISLTEVTADGGAHTGVFQGDWTPANTLEYGVYRIQVQGKHSVSDTTWLNFSDISLITLSDRPSIAYVERGLAADVGDVKVICNNIETYILAKSEAYRELVIMDALKMAHDYVHSFIGPIQYKYRNPVVREAEAIYAVYIILRSNTNIEDALLERFRKDFADRIKYLQRSVGFGSMEMTTGF